MLPDRWLKNKLVNKQKKQPHERPLLTRKEILDLRYRIEEERKASAYKHEVEHRTLGDARSIHRGYGLDYDESRPYYPGDELRFMNWRATARSGEPQMKVFREERRPAVFIVVDRRQSMQFGTIRRLKITQAVRAAAIIAFDARLHNTPVAGVLLESSQASGLKAGQQSNLTWIEESSTESGVFHFIDTSNQPCPPHQVLENTPPSALSDVIKLLTPMLALGSSVVLISDFHDLDSDCRSSLLELSMTHHLQAIQIIDPAEKSLPACGNLLLQSNDQSITAINSSDKEMREKYQLAAGDYLLSKQTLFRSLGISCQTLMTNEDHIESMVSAW